MNLKDKAALALGSLFKNTLIETHSEKFIEAITSGLLTEADRVRIESEMRKNGFNVVMLGVSGVEKGYRIWGEVFETAEELQVYLNTVVHGHKEIGTKLELFEFKEEGVGSVFWLERGLLLRKQFEQYLLEKIKDEYHVIKTPVLIKKDLWEKSGHLDAFSDNMCFVGEEYSLKPMNCPCHMLIFGGKTRSYKELPYRIFEYGEVHRNEASGALNGLLRLKNFTIDDGHIFCTIDHIKDEVEKFIQMTHEVYKDFGFTKVLMYLATRPEKYKGDLENWNKAEEILRELGLEEKPGEGAFYGPKIEFHLEDAMGRLWQCGTIQLDFVLPVRMGLKYTSADGQLLHPVVLHRAILGSMERFMAILLENNQGWLPDWLAPDQLMIIPTNPSILDYALSIKKNVNKRAVIADISHTLGKNIHRAQTLKIPYVWIIGKKEIEDQTITVRDMRTGTQVVLTQKELGIDI